MKMWRRPAVVLLALSSIGLAQSVQSPNQPATPKSPITVDQLIAGLIKQANTFDAGATDFTLYRPHPLLPALPPGSEMQIAEKIADKFTGDPQKDIYIRYHLMYALTHPSGKPVPGEVFSKLLKTLPETIPFEAREWDKYDPPEIGRRYRQLIGEAAITVGFPPFQKWIAPPASFEHMSPEQRKTAEAKYAEAKALEKQFTRTIDRSAQEYNTRVGKTPWMLKQVRGECLYGMVASGEPAMLDAVIKQIATDAVRNPQKAEDAIAFLNATYFDGWLSQYPPEKLRSAAAALKRATIAGDAAATAKPPAKPGAKPPANQPQQPKRNPLADSAFTVITAMETNNVLPRPADGNLTRESPELPRLKPRKVTAASIDRQTIDDAINRAVIALEQIRPPDTDLGVDSYWAAGISAWLKQWILPGNQALANWAFLSAGEGKYDTWLQRRIGWVACFESTNTYDRAMRLRMLADLPLQRWQPWFKRDVTWLLSTMTAQGNFGPGIVQKPAHDFAFGDNANGQYAVLALGAAQRAGYEIDPKVWRQIDRYWRDAQAPAGHKDAGGWALKSLKAPKPSDPAATKTYEFDTRVTLPMTAGGVLALATTERILLGPTRLDTSGRITPELDAGLKWLDRNFSVEAVDGDSDLYYYLWTIQNVGQATGYRKFNNIDWFREATAVLLNQQGADGLWKGPKGPTVSTSFALLYLYRARGPLAFCKVRFGDTEAAAPAARGKGPTTSWNNRPNDLANLTDDITEMLEVPTSWQIADLDQPVYELIESATLYLTTDKPFTLTDAQIARLREYINAGGLLILAPEGNNPALVIKSMQNLAQQLYPDRELVKLPAEHGINTISRKLSGKLPVSYIDSGTRPLVVLIEKDISRDLQANQRKKNESFDLMTNLYLYAAGRDQRRPRVETTYVQMPAESPKETIGAARIKYAGNFDPEPESLNQLSAFTAKHHNIKLDVTIATPRELKPTQKIAFLTLTEGAKLTEEEAKAIRAWIDAGGTLWVDAAGGRNAAMEAVEESLTRLGFTPNDYKQIGSSPIATGKTRRPGGYEMSKPSFRPNDEGLMPSLRVIEVNARPAVYVARGDIAAGLAGANTFDILGYAPDTTRKYVANSVLDLPK